MGMLGINDKSLTNTVKLLNNNSSVSQRNFIESVDLIINLKKYNIKKYKRITGTIILPFKTRFVTRICVFCDDLHVKEASELGLFSISSINLLKLKNKKKLIKKIVKKFHKFFASEKIVKLVPRYFGPSLTKYGKFPTVVNHSKSLRNQIDLRNNEIKFFNRKEIIFSVVIGNIKQEVSKIVSNLKVALDYFCKLTNMRLSSIESIYLKRTMSQPQRIR